MAYLNRIGNILMVILLSCCMLVLITIASMLDRPLVWLAVIITAWLLVTGR